MSAETATTTPDKTFKTDRHIRVFISSTFRDMQAERDYLVKFIFPQLRKLCESRGVTWGEVDLRWGVTDEEAAEGKVLPICLEEIKRCRPYFIGLLGERYGWVPESIPEELIEREPWLREQMQGHKSVTELEILHGVLDNRDKAQHAFFYFRDPAYLDKLPPEAKREDFTTEDAESAEKLRQLKQQIRASGFPVHENYADPKALGELVLADLTEVINQRWPEGSQPHPLDREAADHEAFAQSRRGVYIGRDEYFERLDAHAAGTGDQPLVILGESGSGKSALLANWFLSRFGPSTIHSQPSTTFALLHFIGGTPYSSDWAAMLRRIMGEFKKEFGITQDIPDKPDALRAAFPNWLHMTAAKGRVILILDALNQLEDRDGAPDLVWLPPVMPENVRLIVSTLPGRALDVIKERRWPVLHVQPLDPAERQQFITDYLAQYTKALSPARAARIAKEKQSDNPLYLRALLEELRIFGEHERLDERIAHYLQAGTVPELYEKILARWEADYAGGTNLVGDAMTLLWAARRGLTEAELLQALGKDGEPLPRALWSPLFLAAGDSLVSRSGLLTFFHDYLRDAVRNAYLPSEESQRAAHLRMADYFAPQSINYRQLDELPWQLTEAAAWPRLCTLLSDLPFFEALWQFNQFDVKSYWAQLEANGLWMSDSYRAVLVAPHKVDLSVIWCLSMLLGDTGHPSESLVLRAYLVEHFRKTDDLTKLQACLGSQAVILQAQGDLEGAMVLHKEQEQICRKLGSEDGIQTSLANQASILQARGDLDGAMSLHRQAEQICRRLGSKGALQALLGNQATILQALGDLDGAMSLHKQAEQICRELGNKDGLARQLGNQAIILRTRGDLDGAMALHKQAEHVCQEIGDKDGLQACFGEQALILQDRGDFDGAMALHKEKERICRELRNKNGLQASLGNQVGILRVRGDLDGAMLMLKQQEAICLELGNKKGLALTLGNQAVILVELGHLDEAMALHLREEQICRELGNKESLQASLGNQARILNIRGDLDGAMLMLKQQEEICLELGNKKGLALTLGNQAVILVELGHLDEAMALHLREEQICRELGYKNGLQASLGNQAAILQTLGNLEGAMSLHKQAEQICRELGNKGGLQALLGNEALILKARGDFEGSMEMFKQQEKICRELRDKDGLSRTFSNQAWILEHLGDLDGAMALHKQVEQICLEQGNKNGLQFSLGYQGLILEAQGDLDGAVAMHKEKERICRELGNFDSLATSLSNQAGILFACDDFDCSLALRKEQEQICRKLGKFDNLALALSQQAGLLARMNRADEGLRLAVEAHQLATQHGYIPLVF